MGENVQRREWQRRYELFEDNALALPQCIPQTPSQNAEQLVLHHFINTNLPHNLSASNNKRIKINVL